MTGSRPVQSAARRKAHKAGSAGREVVGSGPFGALIMIGLVAYGAVHLLIAWMVVQIAWTGNTAQVSAHGAFQDMASTSVGDVLLWVTAMGLSMLALWQSFEALWGHTDRSAGRPRVFARLGSAGRTLVYLALGVSAGRTASDSAPGGNSQQAWTARLLSVPAGQVLIILVGIGIISVGAVMAYRGLKKKFINNLAGTTPAAVLRLGQIGYLTKGFAFSIVGVLFIVAAVTYDPQRAGGLDSAIRTLQQQTYGAFLLTLVALGITCYGLYCFAWSRHARRT